MHINPDGFRDAFEQIRRSSLSHSTCKLVMFVSATDIDALCSARMLASLFKAELIPHKTVPVVGYGELQEKFKELDDDITNVICVGCGATVDLETHFDIVEEEEEQPDEPRRRIYVIDNHRPWNLDNLFGSNQVICLDDGTVDESLEDQRQAYDQMRFDENEDDTDSDDDDNDDDDEDGYDDENHEDNDDEFREDSDRKARKEKRERKRQKRENYAVLENYYSHGTFLTGTSTTQVYSLLSNIGATSVTNLWLAVIGVTSTGIQTPSIYRNIIPVLKDEVARLCPQSTATHSISVNSDDNSLYIEADYAFFLLRHWSLYDSMTHSSYLSAKLELWTEDGKKRLHKMLAKMGISLQESREQWTHMRIDLKRTLKEKLAGITGQFGIEEVIRDGVVRRYGYKGAISAGDAVEALEALLQGPTEYATIQEQLVAEKGKFWVQNFWDGWDALGNVNKLLEGIDRAKILQKIITLTGTALFEKKQIKDLRAYRLAVVKDGPDIGLFRNPLALARLGVWVAEGCAETLKKQLPLVIAALDTVSDTYLVLGMAPHMANEDDDETQANIYNQFGHAFQATAAKIHARVKLDAFESSIIEVAKDDLSRFLEALALSGLVG